VNEHRDCAEQSLVDAQRNPILSAQESFTSAQVQALEAIEQRLDELHTLLPPDAHFQAAS
jgi:hypothetical protein